MHNKTERPDVSVVVPVFNVEAYLKSCLDSLANQTLKRLEVVMVDDGSTDGSLRIMKEYEAAFSHFRLFQRENGGLSAARNTGIKHARGTYIGFVDSDDFVDHSMYETLFETGISREADIVKSGVLIFNDRTREITGIRRIPVKEKICDSPEDALYIYLNKKMNIIVVNGIYRRQLFDDLKFVSGIKYEDHYFTPKALICCSRFVQIDRVHYYYRKRTGSITQSIDTKGRTDKLQSVNELYRVIQKTGSPDEYARLYAEYFIDMAIEYHNSLIYSNPFTLRNKKNTLKILTDTDALQFVLEKGSLASEKKKDLKRMIRSHARYFFRQKARWLKELLWKKRALEKRSKDNEIEAGTEDLKQYKGYIRRYA